VRVRVLATSAGVSRCAAEILGQAVRAEPGLTLGLATGRTMVPFYAALARRHARGDLDLSRVRGFNLDELLLPPDHPASFHTFMAEHVWGRTGLRRERCDIPDPTAQPAAECRRYDRAVAAAGGLDLVFLGVGADGHVAYNLPGDAREEAHVVQVPASVADTLRVPAAFRPLSAITLGLGPLRRAGHLVVLATTAEKARAVRALVHGPDLAAWPCSLLHRHPRLDVLLTPAAAQSVRRPEQTLAAWP
jgi:glucosamine-6-phosphate deaminase